MSKELPYFRFNVSEWLNDDISVESYKIKGIFSDICAYYWFKDCIIDLKTLKKRFKNCKSSVDLLIKLSIIKHDNETDAVNILFLDAQYDMLSEKRKKHQEAGRKGGLASSKQRSSDA